MKKFIFELQRFDATISGSTDFEVTSSGVYTIESGYTGTIKINTTDAVTIDGSSAGELSNVFVIVESTASDLTIKDLQITNNSSINGQSNKESVVQFGVGTDNKLNISGENNFINKSLYSATINVGGGLTVDGDGKLNVSCSVGAGIGSDGDEASSANIIINGGDISVASLYSTGSQSACIGSGRASSGSASIGDITITGGKLNLTSGDGAGIGSGMNIGSTYTNSAGNIKVSGNADITVITNDSTTYGGAGIGTGDSGTVGNIVIDGGKITTVTKAGAGIGSGTNGTTQNIKINSGTINTTANEGAGIGSGWGGTSSKTSSVNSIQIKGGDITATSKIGAGIGSGRGWTIYGSLVGEILISGGKIKSSGTGQDAEYVSLRYSSAAIGCGYGGKVDSITINGTANVEATSTDGAGIGTAFSHLSSYTSVGDITIGGQATVKASSENNGSGIGTGEVYEVGKAEVGNITITDNSVVTATSGGQGAGIGGGYTERGRVNSENHSTSTVGNIKIDGDAVVVATNSENGVGIGAGNKDSDSVNTVGTIILSGDTSTSDKSTVTINNGDTTKELTINGKTFSGAQLVFEDGVSNSSESESGGGDDTTDKTNYTITVSATGQVMVQEDGVIKISESVYKAVFGENTTVKPTDGTLPYYPATGLQLSGNFGSKTIALENNSSSAISLKDSAGKNLVTNFNSSEAIIFSDGNFKADSLSKVTGATFSLSANKTFTSGENVIKANTAGTVTANSATEFELSAAEFTVNGVKVKTSSNTTGNFITDGVKVNLSSNALTYSGMKFTGEGATAEITADNVTLSDGAVVTDAKNNQAFIISGTVKFDDKTIVTAKAGVEITNTTSGIKIGDKTLNISGDTNYTVNIDSDGKISSVDGIGASGGVTVTSAGGATQIFTNKAGAIKFTEDGGKIFTTSGDDSVTFGLSDDGVVESISELSGTVTGNFANEIAVDSKTVKITGDTSVQISAANNAVTEISRLGKNSVVESSGGAEKVVTDEVGKFTFGTGDTAQTLAVGNDTQVAFNLTDGKVTGVESLKSGTLALKGTGAAFMVNNTELTISASDEVTLKVDASGAVTEVANLKNSISDLSGNVTVNVAATDVKINDKTLQINDTDSKYNAILSNGEVVSVTGIGNNSTITKAENLSVITNSQGAFTFGSDTYSISGDTSVTFETDDESKVKNISDFVGSLKTSSNEVTVNGAEFETSNTDAVILSTGEGISGVNNLQSGDTISGEISSAAVSMPGVANGSTSLTVNGKTFELLNDGNGVVIQGDEINGLATNASLKATAGTYTINGTVLNVANDEVIYGTAEGTAEIYSAENTKPVDDSTTKDIEKLVEAVGIDTVGYTEVAESLQSAINNGTAENLDGNMSFTLDNNDNSTQSLDLSETTGAKNISLKDGDQEITFNDQDGNIVQIGSDASGDKNINLGNGEATAIIAKGTKANATVNFGTGKGKLVSGADVLANLAFATMATFRAVSNALMTVTNYDALNTKSGIESTFSNIAAAIGNGLLQMANGVVNTGEGRYSFQNNTSSADIAADAGDTEGSTVFNIYNTNGKMQRVGFTHSEGGTVDFSDQKVSVIMQGNSTGIKSGESSLIGGSGNDTVLAGSGDFVDAGAGSNTIILNSGADNGAVVQMTSTTGRNNISGFNYGFEETNDAVAVDMSKAKISVDGAGNIVIKNGRAKTTLTGAVADAEENSFAEILIIDGAETLKTAVATEGNVIAVSSDADNFANNYVGNNSGLTFNNFESEISLNLADTVATFGGEEVQVTGINNIQLGEGDSTVFGSDAKETITAGSGNDTIWSSGGKDLMSGFKGNAEDKNGSTTFGFITGDGKDTITNFNFLTTENSSTADRIWTNGQFENINLSGNDVILKLNNNNSLRITEAKGKDIQLSENGDLENVTTVLQVSDTLLTYDGSATKYIATGTASIVATSDTSTANIWLNDTETYEGAIKTINASVTDSAVLVGNSYDNVITGSAEGNSSLWGGAGNDTLVGGSGANVFFYGVTGGNEGNDTITGITEDDTVNLFGIQLSDISDFDITTSTITLEFSGGGSLTMANNGQTFMLANDTNQRYTYDKENSEWTNA